MGQLTPAEMDELVAVARKLVRPTYLSRERLAAELDVTVKTVRRMEQDGLPIHHLGGSTYRFMRDEVDSWIKAKKESAA